MPLSRSVATRLLESVWTETKNWLAQLDATTADKFKNADGSYRVYAQPLDFGGRITLVPFQININVVPGEWEYGTSGVGDVDYEVEIDFILPHSLTNLTAGANTFHDYVRPLGAWLAASASNTGWLPDPDNAGQWIARLTKFKWDGWGDAPNGAGAILPVIAKFTTREDESGARK